MHPRFRILRTAIAVAASVAAFSLLPNAFGQVKKIEFVVDNYLCNSKCEQEIAHQMRRFEKSIDEITHDHAQRMVTINPKEGARLDLWDMVKQLKRHQRTPIRTSVFAVGQVEDYAVTLNRTHLHMRKAFNVKANKIEFHLAEGEELDALVAYLEANPGTKEVSILGDVAAFDDKASPILVIKKFKPKGAEWSDDELNPLPTKKETAKK